MLYRDDRIFGSDVATSSATTWALRTIADLITDGVDIRGLHKELAEADGAEGPAIVAVAALYTAHADDTEAFDGYNYDHFVDTLARLLGVPAHEPEGPRAPLDRETATSPAPVEHPSTAFCRSFRWAVAVRWFDRQGVMSLGTDRNVTLTLVELGTHDSWQGFRVRVAHKHTGKIAEKTFAFGDYMDKEDRTAGQDHYEPGYKVVGHVGWRWYVAVPSAAAIDRYRDAIETWIGTWV